MSTILGLLSLWEEVPIKIHSNIGYSGHERGIAPTLASVALGARVIERHFTLDREMEGPDHAASLEFDSFNLSGNGLKSPFETNGSIF